MQINLCCIDEIKDEQDGGKMLRYLTKIVENFDIYSLQVRKSLQDIQTDVIWNINLSVTSIHAIHIPIFWDNT